MSPALQTVLDAIHPVDQSLRPRLQAHLDDLTHPPGSLGRLEDLALRYGLIRGTAAPVLKRKRLYTFAADHGVADEGISIAPKSVTLQMVQNMLAGGAAVNVLCRHSGVECRIVDIGIDGDPGPHAALIRRKIRPGTANLRTQPAMTATEAEQAILVGAELAAEAADAGVDILGTGEMGIGNTTPAAALFAALLPCDPAAVTGRGTGVDDTVLARKLAIVREALERHHTSLRDPLAALAAVGGLEIAGLCGLCLGGAMRRIPVVVDGFIASAAALVACRLQPAVNDYLLFSHRSAEAGHALALQSMQAVPLLDLDMRLGEGTGAALAIGLVEAAIRLYNEMATFSGAGVVL